MNFKALLPLAIFLLSIFTLSAAPPIGDFAEMATSTVRLTKRGPKYSTKDLKARLKASDCPVKPILTKNVKRYIGYYVRGGRANTEAILGRSAIYFPIFDYYIKKHNLPPGLKALSIIESALKPKAKSHAGAAGLWQFMPFTGKAYGLKINNYVDERYDPHKATEAALKYLAHLHKAYGQWELALAAYNCGPKKVEDAMKKVGSRDFWKIRKHLPKETRQYVPRYIAAFYVMNNYYFHDIRPAYPDYNLQITGVTKIFKRRSFALLSEETGISESLIATLNPAFKKQIIPPSKEGYNVILPTLGVENTILSQLPMLDPKPQKVLATHKAH